MTEIEIAWVAGLLEGEGHFSFYRTAGKRRLRVRLHMTDLDVVMKCRNLAAPGRSIHREERSARISKDGYMRKDAYVLDISGFQAEAVMIAILPYMGTRRAAKIEECLAEWNNRKGPVYTLPTDAQRQVAAALLSDLGLE